MYDSMRTVTDELGKIVPNRHPDDQFGMDYETAEGIVLGSITVDTDDTVAVAQGRYRAQDYITRKTMW